MRFLVSVRDSDEARAAMEGGADIIDAKEPARGPLAPVGPDTLTAVCEAVPGTIPLSVALGEARPDELAALVTAVAPLRSRRALFFKAAVMSASPREAVSGIAAACRRLEARRDRPALIVARYVDTPADAEALWEWVDVCADAGARGLLLDTSRKDGQGLLAFAAAAMLAMLRRRAARHGIWLALAGGMTINDMVALGIIRPHVVGFRGAACNGGRTGTLSMERVVRLRQALDGVIERSRPRALQA